jgi:hypothetical protein
MHTFDTPDFKNEQEEANWWDTHEDEIFVAFQEAAKNGTLGRGTLLSKGLQTSEELPSEPSSGKPSSDQKSAA